MFFWRWHPKVALRYLPIVKEIKKSGIENPDILEIGSGSLGIAPYLEKEIIGLDRDFSGPDFPLLKKIYGEATDLPFKDKSFDFSLLVDVLEHLPSEDRQKAIKECLRVARYQSFIAVPCGKISLTQDKELSFLYRKKFAKDHPFFSDHLKYGLPKKEEVLRMIKDEMAILQRKGEIRNFGNINLSLRKFLMSGWMTTNPAIDFFFRKAMLPFIPIFCHFNQESYYREIFIVKFF